MDLTLDLDATRGRRAGLEDALRQAVLRGQLPAGARLPSSRTLAHELGCSRATVVGAYEQLVAEGYLLARRGAGTTVAEVPRPSEPATPARPERPALRADLRPGEPDRSSFPRGPWMTSMRRVLATSPDELFGYPDRLGLPALRTALATYLGRSRAVVADPDRIVIFGGFVSALDALAAAFRLIGIERVAMEDPSLPFHRQVVLDAGLAVEPVPVDGEGMRIDDLAATRAGAVVTTPAHQFPLGVALAAARRTALVDWARRHGTWVVEDDYDGEFRYDRQPVGALQGLDPARVVYAGTASKSLAAGLRLAWLVLPADLLGPVLQAKRWRGEVSSLEQAALADLLESGRLDRHLRRMRTAYRRRRDALVATLADRAPWLELTGIAAGLHAAALLPDDGPTEADLVARARASGIGLVGLGPHWCDEASVEGLVLGYSRPPTHGFPAALEALVELLDGGPRTPRSGRRGADRTAPTGARLIP